MNRRLPPDAFAYYVSLGISRSYQAVADHFDVSKTAVANLAERERWREQLEAIERKAHESSVQKAAETLEQMNDRHLRSLKVIQGKALEALRAASLSHPMDAVRALDLAIRQERLIRGEPTERAALSIEDVVRREYERWMASTPDAGERDGGAGDEAGEGRVEPRPEPDRESPGAPGAAAQAAPPLDPDDADANDEEPSLDA